MSNLGKLMDGLRKDLAKDYQVEGFVGDGGFGLVFKALERDPRRTVALKALPLDAPPGLGERMRREARVASNLDHPNIVPIYKVGQAAGTDYYTMKYVEGCSLDWIIGELGKLPVPLLLRVLRQILAGLAYAHDRRIIHRDLRGANVFVDEAGTVAIADSGIARALEEKGSLLEIAGAPPFMSPEQCAGQRVSPQSDQYSLGVLAFQMLTGKLPFEGDSPKALREAHQSAPVPDVAALRPEAPKVLVEVITKALSKAPSDRYATTRDMLRAVETVLLGEMEMMSADSQLRDLAAKAPQPTLLTDTAPKKTPPPVSEPEPEIIIRPPKPPEAALPPEPPRKKKLKKRGEFTPTMGIEAVPEAAASPPAATPPAATPPPAPPAAVTPAAAPPPKPKLPRLPSDLIPQPPPKPAPPPPPPAPEPPKPRPTPQPEPPKPAPVPEPPAPKPVPPPEPPKPAPPPPPPSIPVPPPAPPPTPKFRSVGPPPSPATAGPPPAPRTPAASPPPAASEPPLVFTHGSAPEGPPGSSVPDAPLTFVHDSTPMDVPQPTPAYVPPQRPSGTLYTPPEPFPQPPAPPPPPAPIRASREFTPADLPTEPRRSRGSDSLRTPPIEEPPARQEPIIRQPARRQLYIPVVPILAFLVVGGAIAAGIVVLKQKMADRAARQAFVTDSLRAAEARDSVAAIVADSSGFIRIVGDLPDDAIIWLDSAQQHSRVFSASAGAHDIEVETGEFKPWETTVLVRMKDTLRVRVELELEEPDSTP